MTLTLTQCEDMILHTLDASELPAELPYTDIVARVGSWLYTVHEWSWLTRTGTVTATIGQNYVVVPVTQIDNLWWAYNLARVARRTTMDHINQIRSRNTSNSYPSYWALGWRDISGVQTRVVEFDFAFTTADVITLQYRQPWILPMTSGNIQVPQEWEGIFVQALRAYARGYQEEDVASLDDRLAKIANCDEMNRLRKMDGMQQSNRGAMRGGIGSLSYTTPQLPDPINIPH